MREFLIFEFYYVSYLAFIYFYHFTDVRFCRKTKSDSYLFYIKCFIISNQRIALLLQIAKNLSSMKMMVAVVLLAAFVVPAKMVRDKFLNFNISINFKFINRF